LGNGGLRNGLLDDDKLRRGLLVADRLGNGLFGDDGLRTGLLMDDDGLHNGPRNGLLAGVGEVEALEVEGVCS
jgi:hypothetical protein